MYTLNLDNVQTLTRILDKDILESAALLNSDLFEKLHIKVLTGIEYQQSKLMFHRKGGTSRRYKAGATIKSTLGFIEERLLQVELCWNRYFDNLQNYREKEPWSVQGTNGSYNAPNSEFFIREVGKSFSEDILANMVWGQKALGEESPMGLFDGFNVQLNREITKGTVRVIKVDPFIDQPAEDPAGNWNEFVKFVNGLHPKMLAAEKVIVYCSPAAHRYIIDGYLKAYQGLQTPSAADKNFRFIGMPNIELCPHAIWGVGNRLIATLPDNFEYGVDTENDWNKVMVDHNPEDFNELIYQIQSAQGVRIARITPDALAVSDQSNKPLDDMAGDWQKASITVSTVGGAHDTAVAVSPKKEDYEAGESVTFTVTQGAGKKFVKWSDGITIMNRTIIASGHPEQYQALFEDGE